MHILLGCLIFSLLVTDGHSTPDKEELKKQLELGNQVVFSHVVSRDTPKGKGAVLLKEKIKNQNLAYYRELQIYPNSLLFNDTKVMTALEYNQVQLAAPSVSKLVKYNPKLQLLDFPFLFKEIEEVETFYNKVKDELFPPKQNGIRYLDQNQNNYIVLTLWHGGMKQLSSNKKISNFQDKTDKPLSNQKIRVQSSPIFKLTFKALGAEPIVEDDFKKVRQKLEKNEIDGQENTYSNSLSENYYEMQKYFTETNHSYLGYLLITSKTFLDELNKHSKDGKKYGEIWKIQIEEVTKEVNNLAQKSNETSKENISKYYQKTELPILDEKQRETWCNSVYSNVLTQEWEKILKEIGKKLIKIVIEGKTGCPFDNLRRILEESPTIPD